MTSSIGKNILFDEASSLKEIEHIQKGDILFFHRQSLNDFAPKEDNKYPGHCGIYLENSFFIHSSRVKGKVVVSDFNKNEYWQKVLVGYKDIFADSYILERVRK